MAATYLKVMGFRNFYATYIDFEDHFLILVVTFIFTILLNNLFTPSCSLSYYNIPKYSSTTTSTSSPVLKTLQIFEATLPRAINIIARRQKELQDDKRNCKMTEVKCHNSLKHLFIFAVMLECCHAPDTRHQK